MNVLLTAAGLGSRFRREGLEVPKPLIRVAGRELLLHTLDSFPLRCGDRLVLGVQRSHGVRERLAASLEHDHPGLEVHWVELEEVLPGQLATAVACLEAWGRGQGDLIHQPLLIHNCDTGFRWPDRPEPGTDPLAGLRQGEAYGTMAVFRVEGEHWSFGRPSSQDPLQAVEIREKRRISDLASIGLYGFRSGAEFLGDARAWLASSEALNGEHFVAPLLQAALERGEVVRLPRVGGVRLYGTPAELCTTFRISREDLQAEQLPAAAGATGQAGQGERADRGTAFEDPATGSRSAGTSTSPG